VTCCRATRLIRLSSALAGIRRRVWWLIEVIGFPRVANRRSGAVVQFGLLGAGAESGGDIGPAGLSSAGVRGEFGDHASGLVDEAGEHGDSGEGITEPAAAAIGELAEGVLDEVPGVVVAVWLEAMAGQSLVSPARRVLRLLVRASVFCSSPRWSPRSAAASAAAWLLMPAAASVSLMGDPSSLTR